MLFLLKRTWKGGLAGLAGLALLGLCLRALLPEPPPLYRSPETLQLGLLVFGLVLASDGVLHGLLLVLLRDRYRRLHRELADLFRDQSLAAIVVGAAMAGIGEELVFRGLSREPLYLAVAALLFGLLHHLRGPLWPFTLWAVWQGVLFAFALGWTGVLGVTMLAHFLHDLTGFLLFRCFRRRALPPP